MKRHFKHLIIIFSWLLLPVAAMAENQALVSAGWLEQHINDPKLVLLEVRYHPHRYFTVGHISGARQVQRFKDLGDNNADPLMRFPSQKAFQNTLRRWGVNNDSVIVIYDDSRTALASRLYFLLNLYGYDMSRVKVLDGGTIEWTAFNELSTKAIKPKAGKVILKPANQKLFVEWTAVYDDVVSRRDPGVVLLDARPHDMYTGKVIQHAIQGGHIPGAINVVSLDGTDALSQKWLSKEQLAEMYKAIPKNKTIYVYCHDGFRMSLAFMQLKSLGYIDVRMYNGGWSHWGNSLTLPVVEGNKPYDEAFAL
ncbi:MAG: rhodanese-like domain-containing protein [Gammaproteobacteria bacterium]|nr:rhodanese-like domain-containing protein [Gammaproteobacteria bacterium]